MLLQAQAPAGYYSAAKEKSGAGLKTALFSIICDHVQRSYKNLWTDFQTTDKRPDGKVWDMYSCTTNYTFGKDQAGNYKREGDVYNREHSFPKSWFDDDYPMYTDLFHLVPTDGYVNGMRSNLPFGETDAPTYTSNEGFSKVGPCSVAGYAGKVFEPNDEYKGDFARIYFYMATAYEDQVSTWNSPMLDGSEYPAYSDWALSMLLRWAQEDPVSQKEIDRNNAVYGIQHNRNPYVDFPGLEQYVWGKYTSERFDPDNYGEGGGTVEPDPAPDTVEPPVFSPASGEVERGTEVTISSATAGARIYYTINGGSQQEGQSPVSFLVGENTTVRAFSTFGQAESEVVTAIYTVPDVVEPPVFSPASGEVERGTEVTISSATAGARIYYTINGGSQQEGQSPVSFFVEENTTVRAFSTFGQAESEVVTATYTVRVPEVAEPAVFVRAGSEADLLPGSRCLIVCEPYACALGEKGSAIRKSVPVVVDGTEVETATGGMELPYALVLGTVGSAYTFFDAVTSDYLALTTGANKLHALPEPTSAEAQWYVSFYGDYVEIINRKYDTRRIQYNHSAPRFACYTGSQQEVALYVERATVDGIPMPFAQGGLVDVCTSGGRLLRSKVPVSTSLQGLPRGIYIVGGTKVLVH